MATNKRDETKLPAWVQNELQVLRARVQTLQEQIEHAMPFDEAGNAPVAAIDYSAIGTKGSYCRTIPFRVVRFRTKRGTFDVSIAEGNQNGKPGGLLIYGESNAAGRIYVRPRSSNVVVVDHEEDS